MFFAVKSTCHQLTWIISRKDVWECSVLKKKACQVALWVMYMGFWKERSMSRLVTLVFMHVRRIIDCFYFVSLPLPSKNWFVSSTADIARRKRRNKTDIVLYWFSLPEFSYFLNSLLCSGHFTNPKYQYFMPWEWDSAINCLSGAFTNSSDKCYWFYLNTTWGSVSFAHKWPVKLSFRGTHFTSILWLLVGACAFLLEKNVCTFAMSAWITLITHFVLFFSMQNWYRSI